MASFSAGTTFTDGVANDVTAAKLAALVNAATPTSGFIQDRTAEATIAVDDTLLIGDASDSNNLKRMTVANFRSAATFGTTTSTAATITSGTITNLASTTGTIATLNSTTGTIATLNSTTGTIATLNSTTPTFLGAITASTNTINVGSGQIYKDSSGNVGLGTASPTRKLTISASGGSFPSAINPSIRLDETSSGRFGLIEFDSSTNLNIWASDAGSGSIKFFNGTGSGTERLRIDSSGNLLVGTTSNFSADKMCLNFTSAQNGLGVRDDSNSSGANYAVFRNSTNGITGTIARATTTNAVAYNTTSDQRLKSNIADASPVLDKLMDVKVRQFDWTEGNLHQDAGFIAQELAPVLSGIVTEGRTQDDWWQLDYARLTPYLVKAVQELKTENDSLKSRIEALEAK